MTVYTFLKKRYDICRSSKSCSECPLAAVCIDLNKPIDEKKTKALISRVSKIVDIKN